MTTPTEPTPEDVTYDTDFDTSEHKGKSDPAQREKASKADKARKKEQEAAIRASRKLRTDGNPNNGEAEEESPIKDKTPKPKK